MAKGEKKSFFNSFNSEFQSQLKNDRSCKEAFEAACDQFRLKVGETPYNNWDSFKSRRSQERRKP